DLKGRTPAEAFLAIVEGQGLAYAVALDPTGTRVETVLMAGGNNAPTTNAGPAPNVGPPPPPPRPERVAPEPVVAEPLEDADFADEDQAPPEAGRVVPHAKPSEAPPPPSQ